MAGKAKEIEVREMIPNYKIKCSVCGLVPTVDSKDSKGVIHHHEMCGPCTWGEADMIDPANW